MCSQRFGKTLLIANPYAKNGEGESTAKEVFLWLLEHATLSAKTDLALTDCPGHAEQHAVKAGEYDTVIALGGDGLVHEVVNGLMKLDEQVRPLLFVVAIGSGNDFASTLCLTINDPFGCLQEAEHLKEQYIDLGKVNGAYFTETLSFGIDAAIAIDTLERRKVTGKSGMALYLDSGLRIFSKKQDGYHFQATLDGTKEIEGTEVCFACQNGVTFGGGFQICPAASPVDGKLDLCYTKSAPSRMQALSLIMKAKNGKHVGTPSVGIEQFKSLHVTFSPRPPVQIDGEKFEGETFDIQVVPKALKMLVGPNFAKRYAL